MANVQLTGHGQSRWRLASLVGGASLRCGHVCAMASDDERPMGRRPQRYHRSTGSGRAEVPRRRGAGRGVVGEAVSEVSRWGCHFRGQHVMAEARRRLRAIITTQDGCISRRCCCWIRRRVVALVRRSATSHNGGRKWQAVVRRAVVCRGTCNAWPFGHASCGAFYGGKVRWRSCLACVWSGDSGLRSQDSALRSQQHARAPNPHLDTNTPASHFDQLCSADKAQQCKSRSAFPKATKPAVSVRVRTTDTHQGPSEGCTAVAPRPCVNGPLTMERAGNFSRECFLGVRSPVTNPMPVCKTQARMAGMADLPQSDRAAVGRCSSSASHTRGPAEVLVGRRPGRPQTPPASAVGQGDPFPMPIRLVLNRLLDSTGSWGVAAQDTGRTQELGVDRRTHKSSKSGGLVRGTGEARIGGRAWGPWSPWSPCNPIHLGPGRTEVALGRRMDLMAASLLPPVPIRHRHAAQASPSPRPDVAQSAHPPRDPHHDGILRQLSTSHTANMQTSNPRPANTFASRLASPMGEPASR